FHRILLVALGLYPSWLGMMAVHEAGHVLHALLSGGAVTGNAIPLLGFSRTDVSPNPHPVFVTVGGSLWGCILPYVPVIALQSLRIRPPAVLRFFAGFCCVVNGTYIGSGVVMPAGDTAVLRSHGVPPSLLAISGP